MTNWKSAAVLLLALIGRRASLRGRRFAADRQRAGKRLGGRRGGPDSGGPVVRRRIRDAGRRSARRRTAARRSQFVPDADFDPQQHVRGVLVARLPGGGSTRLRLEFGAGAASPDAGNGIVETAGFRIVHDPAKEGGLPSQLVFRGTGKTLESIRWQDRLHHAQHGGFRIADDRQAGVTRIADGPLCTAVRVASPVCPRRRQRAGVETGRGLPVAVPARSAAGVRDCGPASAAAVHLERSPFPGIAPVGRRTAAMVRRQSGPERRIQGGGQQSAVPRLGRHARRPQRRGRAALRRDDDLRRQRRLWPLPARPRLAGLAAVERHRAAAGGMAVDRQRRPAPHRPSPRRRSSCRRGPT